MINDPWFPKNINLVDNHKVEQLIFSGNDWQIYSSTDNSILATIPELMEKWIEYKLLNKDRVKYINFGNRSFKILVSSQKIKPIDYTKTLISYDEAISFAKTLRETRKILPSISLKNAIYFEEFSCFLPTTEMLSDIKDDKIMLGSYLSGGVGISTDLVDKLNKLTPFLTLDELKTIINIASFSKIKSNNSSFSLPGSSYLEKFFFENVIDIVKYPEKYEPLGILFPSPIILYGKPGVGKTYAVEKLAEFLDWPLFSITSSSIGSKYIHETGKMIADVFKQAINASPSIIIIDEMESFLSKRDETHQHHIEEVGEFLRLIPEASKNKVLIVGMTNLIESIDPAIRRRGRFDNVIEVRMPNSEDIENLIRIELEKLPIEDNISLKNIVNSLVGRPRSDISFILKEAARLTAFRNKKKISQIELDEALNKVIGMLS
jgi:hypothetical protein